MTIVPKTPPSAPRVPRAWEPIAAFALAIAALALTGCMGEEDTQSAQFAETKAECESTAIPHAYVIHWKDNSVSVERGYTREDFEQKIFEPNKPFIRLVEQDQRVQISPMALGAPTVEDIRPMASGDPSTAAVDQWGQNIIEAPAVWSQGIQGAGVTVAVVDSGVDVTHVQLRGRLAVNTKEIPGNGIDDDGNGLVDDVSGWDFFAQRGVVTDGAGHGTHVAGIILAEHGISNVEGVAPQAKLLPLRFMDNDGQGNISDAILAMKYAAAQGARVINASWGGSLCSQTLSRTIADLDKQGVLFVVAAGNSGANLDSAPEYPASYLFPNQITVGASTARDYTAGFSNYSFHFVHLFAPGASILSTYPGNRLAALSGTSMAAPFVAGAAALLFSAHPDATVAQVRAALLSSVEPGDFAAITKGRLDIKKALANFH